ncbi:MAG: AAC(3) family N-acetyltransferase [Bacteroidia bacterium]
MNDRLRNLLIRYSPEWILEFAKSGKKSLRRKSLRKQEQRGGWSLESLVQQLQYCGLEQGDSVLVHSSLSKMGFVQGGPETVVDALLQVIGPQGTLLMPTFPAAGRNKDYLDTHPVFDAKLTPSAMGSITETFRKRSGVVRSLHPTDPVAALGPLADYYTSGHFGQLTPYNEHSPFRRLAEKDGKILMLGTTLNGAGTSLHTLEDAVDFPFPVYLDKTYDCTIVDAEGRKHTVTTKVHNPEMSVRRNCDALKPMFIRHGVLRNCTVGEAVCMLIGAKAMLEVMIREFSENGVTMYTPLGTKQQA